MRPGKRVYVEILLSCVTMFSIGFLTEVTVPGSIDFPLFVMLSAADSGSKVELEHPDINWGNCSCLVDHEIALRMKNVSLISATYKARMCWSCHGRFNTK